MQPAIDQRIKHAQRKGVGVYFLSGGLTLLLLICFALWLFFVKGFSLIIGPADALKSAHVEVVEGFAWVGDQSIYTLGGEVVLAVSADTFQTGNFSINKQSPSTINIELLPMPAVINANATSADSSFALVADQIQWYVNADLVHVGAQLNHSTPPGTYQLIVSHPYYQDAVVELNLERAQTLELSPQLGIIKGSLGINSLPQGIDVMVNQQIIGKTPLTYEVDGGLHNVQLLSQTFQNTNEDIAVQSSFLHPTRNYQLAPKQGQVNITAKPNNGLLLINNVEYPLGQVSLAANKGHKITYSKNGFSTFTKEINVDSAKAMNLDINLQALFSDVSITSNVPALLTLNGKAEGSVPFKQTLAALTHTIELTYPGYRSVKQKFVAQGNKPTQMNVRMLTEFDARRAEGKALFIEGLGINMLRFRGNAFSLGSPDNEQGRRRNEHQVSVDFSRQFWVSDKEITQAQYAAFNKQKPTTANHPVTGVSWLEAAQYTNWLSEQEGLPVFYKFANGRYLGVNENSRGYRLPTEAEYEWLAKKSKRAVSTMYVWGNNETLRNNYGNFADKARKTKQLIVLDDYEDKFVDVAAVGSFKADRNGLYDLSGNVSEWAHDKYSNRLPDMTSTHTDYLGMNVGDAWVIKGGSFETGRMRELRAAFREFGTSGKPNLGFRIARYDR